MKYKMKRLRVVWHFVSCSLLMLPIFGWTVAAQSLTPGLTSCDIQALIEQHPAYDSCGQSICGSTTSSSSSLDTFLRALSYLETGGTGDPKTGSPSSSDASGKYQYLGTIWRSHLTQYYDPALATQYPTANSAPEAIQDVVAYIEYTDKAIQYKGDVGKMAVSHIYPAVADDPSKWEFKEGKNPTAREYAKIVIDNINAGHGSSFPMQEQQAPDFQKYLVKYGTAPELTIDNTEIGGSGNSTVAGSTVTNSASCVSSCTPGGTTGANGKTIVLDPGHALDVSRMVDPANGLRIDDYRNPDNEMLDVFDVAKRVETVLTKDGYDVILTKKDTSVDGATANLKARAEVANNAQAALEVSIHTNTDGENVVMYPDAASYRTGTQGTTKKYRPDPSIEAPSKQAAGFVGVALGFAVKPVSEVEQGRAWREGTGNSLISFIYAKQPWAYAEMGAQKNSNNGGTLTESEKQKYAEGITKGVEQAVPISGGGQQPQAASGCSIQSQIIQTILKYAWPDYRASGTSGALDPKPEYKAAMEAAKAANKYLGDVSVSLGADCGAFVTRVMQDSGADPNYGDDGNTTIEKEYMDKHPNMYQNLGTSGVNDTDFVKKLNLQAGDIAVNDEHTYIYVGQLAGFNGNAASASQNSRTAMAGPASPASANNSDFNWYRRVGP